MTDRQRLELAIEMARQGKLTWQIVKATGMTTDQVREIKRRVGRNASASASRYAKHQRARAYAAILPMRDQG